MKNILYKLVVTTGLAIGLISFNANAGLIGTSAGTWSNPITGNLATADTIMGEGTDTISWGCDSWSCDDDGGDQSSWEFEGGAFDAPEDGTPFELGHFTHTNNPIYKGKFFGADLDLDLTIGGELSILSFTFDHWETLNKGYMDDDGNRSCPYGVKPCADIVWIPFLDATDTITIGGMVYEMTIAGFYVSPGIYDDHLVTGEEMENWAGLYASLSKVPEPSVIALFGIGLLGLGFASRRKANG